MRNVGFNSVTPEILKVSFRQQGKLSLYLEDGRILSVPLSRFPGIEKLTIDQRKQYHIADGNLLLFPGDDEIYHIQDFLGTYETNAYQSPEKQYTKRLISA